VLGAAGPCLVRSEDFLTLYGLMFFDTDDLAFLEQNNIFDEVVVHEMGHVLGFGTLWNFGRSLLQGTNADPRFVGPNGIAGYLDVGGRGNSVPVEEDFGPGTAFSHWDEETFDEELMTGFIALGNSPLSIMTIGSMQDLGYSTNPAAAEQLPRERAAGTGGFGPACCAVRSGGSGKADSTARRRRIVPAQGIRSEHDGQGRREASPPFGVHSV
jgi:hypothetical protein